MARQGQKRGGVRGFLANHSLTLVVAALLALWIGLYRGADPDTHWGSFFGNSIADWLGTLTFILLTKYYFEVGSRESRTPRRSRGRNPVLRFMHDHSLTLAIVATGAFWVWLFERSAATSKAGQVYGNIVSEWGQLLALVIMTKYFRETGSKDG